MVMHATCPKCKMEYDLENCLGGRQLACQCGEKFSVPEAPDGQDYRCCPDCHNLSPLSNVICLECGFNFSTRAKIKVSAGERGPGFWLKYGYWIKKLALLLVVAAVGWAIYHYMTARPFGMSGNTPLGRFAELDPFIKQMEFDRNELSASAKFPECKIYNYTNAPLMKQTKGLMEENICLVVDAAGNIQAFAGNYSIPAISISGTPVSRFLSRVREELGLSEKPDFKAVTHGKGRFSWVEYIYNGESPQAKVYWSKVEHAQGLIGSSHKIIMTQKQYTPDGKFLQSKNSGFEE